MLKTMVHGEPWKVDDRLGFLWMSTVAIKSNAENVLYDVNEIHRSYDQTLIDEHRHCRRFEDEARDIGYMIAPHGLREMVSVLDAVEGLLGLNAGEWVSRRWDGIAASEGVWSS